MKSIYELSVKDIKGKTVSLEEFSGKKLVILNVASKCAFTSQYADWEDFYRKNNDSVVVLGFPSNEFGNQEPGSNDEIEAFCSLNYEVTFPMFSKISVKGGEKDQLYKWLSDASLNGWNNQEPVWNFCKYLVNENGELIKFFGPDVKPDNPEFVSTVNLSLAS